MDSNNSSLGIFLCYLAEASQYALYPKIYNIKYFNFVVANNGEQDCMLCKLSLLLVKLKKVLVFKKNPEYVVLA